jgi:hypothetical protein
MIHLVTSRNPLNADAFTREWVQHRHGITIADIAPDWAASPETRVTRDGVEIPREDWTLPIPDQCRVEVIERPGFIAALFGLTGVLAAIVNIGAAFAINLGVSYLLGAFRKPKQPDENDSATYGFGGLSSVQDSNGAAVPIILGEHLTGGVVINRFERVSQLGTELWTLLLLSEGRIHSIGGKEVDGGPYTSQAGDLPTGMLINGQPAEDFDEVEVYVRMGSVNQDPIPGFANAEQILEVGFDLEESITPGPGLVELTPKTGGFDPTADAANIALWDTLEAYTTDVDADEFGVIVEFPAGLYTTSGGGIGPNTAQFQIRYRALDGGGSPTGNYVVIPPEAPISASLTNPLTVEFRHPFYSAASYTATGPGERVIFDGINDRAEVGGLLGYPAVAVAQQKLTYCLWFWFTGSLPGPSTTNSYVLAEQFTGSSGWRVILRIERPSASDGYFVRIRTVYGNGTTTINDDSTPIVQGSAAIVLPAIQAWNFFGQGVDNENNVRTRHINGVSTAGAFSFDVAITSGTTFYLADTPTATESPFPGYMDGFKIFSRYLSVADFAQQYNGGAGLNGLGNEPDLVASWQFDSSSGGDTPDSSPNGNDLTLTNGASISTGGAGLLSITPSGTITRGKYRIEVQRLDAQSTGLNENDATWARVRLTTFEDFEYPGCALMAVRVRADGQLSGGAPEFLVPVKGVLAFVWDGVSQDAPTGTYQWSANPAWISLTLLTDDTWGLADYYKLTDIDLALWADWAAYCDEFVEDGRESRGGGNTVTLTYSAPTLTIEIDDVTDGIPSHWEVGGYVIVRDATDTTYNLSDGYAAVITSLDYDAGTEVLTIECTWPTGPTAPTAGPTADATAEVIGAEVRFRFDGVLDRRDEDAWETILNVMASGRAAPLRRGSRLSVFVDRPAEPVATVSMSNIIQGSFAISWVSQHDRPNFITAEILDRDDGYRRVPVEAEHPTASDPTTFSAYRRRAIALEGITRQSQALRHITHELNVHHLVRRRAEWEMPWDGLAIDAGDVVRFTHDLPGWAPSGLFRAGCTVDELYLDRAVEVTGTFGMTWVPRGTGTAVEFTDANPSGTYAAGDVIELATPLSAAPNEGDAWILTSEVPYQLMRVVEARFDPDRMTRRFVALQYDADVYDDGFADFLNAPSTLPVPGSKTVALLTTAPPAVENLRAETRSHETADGSLATYAVLSWDPGTDQGQVVERHEIYLSDRDVRVPMKWLDVSGRERRATIPIEGLDPARSWRWHVRTVGVGGRTKRLDSHAVASWVAPDRSTVTRRTEGATLPTDPRDGDLHWHSTDAMHYRWDDTRAKWLALDTFQIQFGSSATVTNANSSYSSSGPAGFYSGNDLVITRLDFFQVTGATTTIDLKIAGATVHSVTATATRAVVDNNIDEVATSGQLIVPYINGTAANGHSVILTARRYRT